VTARRPVRFESGGVHCAAWHYPGENGACVVMAAGLAVTKEPGTDPLAALLHDAGYSVLAFDYRRLGESGGQPRQVVRPREQLADWRAAIAFARALPEVDSHRIAAWGFSLSGGHVFRVAAEIPGVAAAIAHSPGADLWHATRNAAHGAPLRAGLGLMALAALDWAGGLVGRESLTVPLTGPRGSVASITTPDSQNGPRALNPGNRYPDWRQEIAARSTMGIALYRPARVAARIRIPLVVIAYEDDGVTPPGPAIAAAERAPHGELALLPGGHYEAFIDDRGRERALTVILDFLQRAVAPPPRPTAAPPAQALPRQ
jgi:uncharacterized protein